MKTHSIKIILLALFSMIVSGIYAQTNDDPVLMTIGGDKVTRSEFLNVYNKNNLKKDVVDKKSLEEYLDLYINFKLKVKEAEALGLDTVTAFKTELAGYRKQLAQPYLADKEVNDKLLQEAYDRMKWDLRASHILIKVGPNASAADTLKAYNKIMALRKRIVDNKEDFTKVAMEASDDQYAKDQPATTSRAAIKGNGGDLGYFTALDLIYPFETAAYNLKVGEVSLPIRTEYGYHLIKLTDKKPAMGKVQVAHIIVIVPADSAVKDSLKYKSKIYEIYNKIKAGSSFEDMAKEYSDDKASAQKGGVLPAFGVNRMVPEFIVAISKLKNNGDISEPVKTIYGWHIIKLIERKSITPFDSIKSDLKMRVTKDSRSSKSKESMAAKVKKEYGFKEEANALKDFYKVVDDSIFLGKWRIERAKNLNKPMFTIGDKSYNQQDFASYLSTHITTKSKEKEDSSTYVDKIYKDFVNQSAIDYEDSKLETKYPEFKSLMKEYRDGILLFGLTDEKVWTKAVKDTTGLEDFYNKNKENYMWDERLDASIYSCSNATVAKATRKLVKKGKLTDDEILKQINKDSQLDLKIEKDKYLKKDNALIDSIPWVAGITKNIVKGDRVIFVKVNKILPKQPKSLSEVKGLITADYQTYLEKNWITELKKKYPVVVNKDVFSTIK